MTGYGTGRVTGRGFSVEVEVQTYNHRFLDVNVKLPPEYLTQENLIVKKVNSRLSRGRVNVFVRFRQEKGRYSVSINESLAGKYWSALNRLRRTIGVDTEINPEVLIGLPGVLRSTSVLPSAREFQRSGGKALDEALDKTIMMREKEGGRLCSDLERRVGALKKSLARIKTRLGAASPAGTPGRGERDGKTGRSVPASVPEAGTGVNIQEELTRLESHMEQLEGFLKRTGPVGKTLEFICREILRETTTLGDKASDVLISKQVILMKSEIESLREQIRNVE